MWLKPLLHVRVVASSNLCSEVATMTNAVCVAAFNPSRQMPGPTLEMKLCPLLYSCFPIHYSLSFVSLFASLSCSKLFESETQRERTTVRLAGEMFIFHICALTNIYTNVVNVQVHTDKIHNIHTVSVCTCRVTTFGRLQTHAVLWTGNGLQGYNVTCRFSTQISYTTCILFCPEQLIFKGEWTSHWG